VAVSVTVTFTPATAAPVASVMVPRSVAFTAWPKREAETESIRSGMMIRRVLSAFTWNLRRYDNFRPELLIV
jgi:hypothetical protein